MTRSAPRERRTGGRACARPTPPPLLVSGTRTFAASYPGCGRCRAGSIPGLPAAGRSSTLTTSPSPRDCALPPMNAKRALRSSRGRARALAVPRRTGSARRTRSAPTRSQRPRSTRSWARATCAGAGATRWDKPSPTVRPPERAQRVPDCGRRDWGFCVGSPLYTGDRLSVLSASRIVGGGTGGSALARHFIQGYPQFVERADDLCADASMIDLSDSDRCTAATRWRRPVHVHKSDLAVAAVPVPVRFAEPFHRQPRGALE